MARALWDLDRREGGPPVCGLGGAPARVVRVGGGGSTLAARAHVWRATAGRARGPLGVDVIVGIWKAEKLAGRSEEVWIVGS